MAPQKPGNKVNYYKRILQGFYNHSITTFYVWGIVLGDEHKHIYFHDAYKKVGKTDVYQVIYKYKMTCTETYIVKEKYKNESDLIKLP